MMAVLVTGLVIDAIRKIASSLIGWAFVISIPPRVRKCANLPFLAIATTTPAIRPSAIYDSNRASTRLSRSLERPTDSGAASGRPWADTLTEIVAREKAISPAITTLLPAAGARSTSVMPSSGCMLLVPQGYQPNVFKRFDRTTSSATGTAETTSWRLSDSVPGLLLDEPRTTGRHRFGPPPLPRGNARSPGLPDPFISVSPAESVKFMPR